MSSKTAESKGLVVACKWVCGICSAVCADCAIAYGSSDVVIDTGACSRCLVCTRVCPAGILKEETFA